MNRVPLALGLALLAASPAYAAPAAPSIDAKVEALLKRMTLAEKIGQMNQFSEGNLVTGPGKTVGLEANVAKGYVGSVFNAIGVERTRQLQELAVKKSRLGIPLLFGLDVIHGYKTIFPIPLAEACSWDMAAIEAGAHTAAAEAAADGIHWTFAPMVDIARDPRWGRIAEGAGEDVYLGSAIARARVRGFQGPDLKADDRVVACVKHFAAYGAALAGRDYSTVDLSRRALLETYLPPYKAAIDAGARTVMSSFNEVDGVPATINKMLLTDTLRDAWKFKGFVVSDWTSIMETVPHGVSADLKDAARQAANAGLDMDMQAHAYLGHLAALVGEKRVAMKQIDDAVRRILRVKFEKGLFDAPYRAFDARRRDAVVFSAASRATARDVARKSIVLLKNEKQALPLSAGQKIALVGPLADARPEMLGTWAAQGQGDRCVSVLDAMQARKLHVEHARGCEILGDDRAGFQAALDAAKRADVVVAVMGEAANMSGEAASRAELGLPGVQRELLQALVATGKPVVLVAMNGRPLVLTWEDAHLPALVEAWHLGTEAGNAVADVLFGDYNPSGKLVSTFPRAVGQVPLFYDHMNTGRPFNPKDHYTTHYQDVSNDPVYPFGHGLSYTAFAFGPLKLSGAKLAPTGTITVETVVTNTGGRDGEEVAQLYIRDRVGSVNRPVRQLKGFRKLALKRGESRTVRFTLAPEDLAFWRRDMTFGAEAGQFDVWVGPSSVGGSHGEFALTRSVAVKPW